MALFTSYFEKAVADGASDIHLVTGQKPLERLHGELVELASEPLGSKDIDAVLTALLTDAERREFAETKELDCAVDLAGARWRINVHLQENSIGIAARYIPKEVPTGDTLHFESTLKDIPNLLDGLVLVVGPTGSGKSTTIAAMIEQINATRKAHIVTIEDPVEFMFTEKKSLIEQREVGTDTNSFAEALKHVLRQDPNVIFVGEMRDPETISTVLTAAETGHLVFSTLHTGTAAEAVERIVDVFEGARQRQVLIQLSGVLRCVIAQQLVPGTNGGLVAAREVLMNTPAVANIIRENNVAQLKSVIQTGTKDGMQTMETALKQLVKDGVISEDTFARRTGRTRKV